MSTPDQDALKALEAHAAVLEKIADTAWAAYEKDPKDLDKVEDYYRASGTYGKVMDALLDGLKARIRTLEKGTK